VTRLRSQHGVALPVVCGTLLVIGLLSATLALVATKSTKDSDDSRSSVRALAAAQAGLSMANYRLNKLAPADDKCVTDAVSAPNAGSDCTVTESVGNGATYTYWVTQKIPAGSGCDSLPGTPSTGTHRCITSVGTVHGVMRRIQARTSALPATPPFMPVHGLFGLDRVEVENNLDLGSADLGTNGLIDLGDNDSFGYAQLGPTALCPDCDGGHTNYSGTVHNPTPFTLQPPPIAGTESANDNSVLSAGDGYGANRSLLMTHDLTLPEGDYNFCRLDFGGHDLSPAPGATIRIFIDAPSAVRPGSGCPSNTTPPTASPMWGELQGDNAASVNAPDGDPAHAQIFVYGWPPIGAFATAWGVNTITFSKNDGELDALVYAPSSIVNVAKNNGKIKGGVAAYRVAVKNNLTFEWDASLDTLGASGGTADQKGWFECTPHAPDPSVPESGC